MSLKSNGEAGRLRKELQFESKGCWLVNQGKPISQMESEGHLQENSSLFREANLLVYSGLQLVG